MFCIVVATADYVLYYRLCYMTAYFLVILYKNILDAEA